MGALEVELGVPETAVTIEASSHSTLQNALLSAAILPPETPVIPVTEGFHMPRAIFSARWAGLDVSGYRAPRAFRDGLVDGSQMLVRAAFAWPFNLARIAAYEGAGWLGASHETRLNVLS